MANVDLSNLDLKDLKALQKDVSKAIKQYEERRRKEALAAAEATAQKMGFTLAELTREKTKPRAASAPKYRHPENASITWTGRGRKPKWFMEAIASGKSPDDLLIV
ncbi:transcriptional regulator [Maritimibacter sp. 55A14]|uniref:H-NS histone family protein n=1 Tax=Maritimibacter sp. 55A14 TaxID=2174844 RepID=UPI000D616F87|nr:H-NS histone family protein [Maritimibacter sp. 55A14]PWE34097.1 transcriptional regulator [Maritimibacter sp. 55A14]